MDAGDPWRDGCDRRSQAPRTDRGVDRCLGRRSLTGGHRRDRAGRRGHRCGNRRAARAAAGLDVAVALDPRAPRILEALGRGEVRWFRAPDRVNLMGDHTDYNAGFVLPAAIDRDCPIGARQRPDGRIVVRSLDVSAHEGAAELAADGSEEPASFAPRWGRYVAGVVRSLAELGRSPVGIDAALSSTVPLGSGLSSSAALEVATAVALSDLASFAVPVRELALACQRAEQLATGVRSGIMDQLTSLAGTADGALLIDCRSLAVDTVPIHSSLGILVVHSGRARELADTAYGDRRAACELAAVRLGLAS